MPGIWLTKHISGPSEHSRLSNNTDMLPDTVIWPCKRPNIYEFNHQSLEFTRIPFPSNITSCSFKRCPITERLSPKSLRWAAASVGPVPMTLYGPGAILVAVACLAVCLFLLVTVAAVVVVAGDDFSFLSPPRFLVDPLLRFKNFDFVDFATACASFFSAFADAFEAFSIFDAIRLARRRHVNFSVPGTLAHISLSRRDIAAKSISGLVFIICWRASFAHIIYAVYRLLPLSLRIFFLVCFSAMYALFLTVVSTASPKSSFAITSASSSLLMLCTFSTDSVCCGSGSSSSISESTSSRIFRVAGDSDSWSMARDDMMDGRDISFVVVCKWLILCGLGCKAFFNARAASTSSGDWKSVNLDDFLRTRPLRDTPVTSKSTNTNMKSTQISARCHNFSALADVHRSVYLCSVLCPYRQSPVCAHKKNESYSCFVVDCFFFVSSLFWSICLLWLCEIPSSWTVNREITELVWS